MPDVDSKIGKFINKLKKDYGNIDSEYIGFIRTSIIDDAENLDGVTDKLRKNLAEFCETADLSGDIMEQYQMHLANSSIQTSHFSGLASKAKGVLKGFGAALGSMAVNWAIGEIIGLAANFFSDLENKEKIAAENAKNMASSLQEFHESFHSGSQKIGELAGKYEELSKGVSSMGNNISLTDEQYTEYKQTVSELSEIMPNLTTLFNEQGEKIGFTTGKIKDASKEYQNYIKQQAQNYLREGDKEGNKYQDILDDFDYSNEKNTYGWSNIWRDSLGGVLEGASLYFIPDGINQILGGGHVDFGSELFGAEAEYSTKEQIEWLQKLVNTSKDSWSDILHDSGIGDSKQANLVEELLGINVDKVSDMYDDEYNQLQQSLSQKITALQQTLDGKANQITSGMQSMLLGDDSYWNIKDEDVRNALSTTISGLNYDVLTNLGIDLSDQNLVETWVGNLVDDINSNKKGVSDAIKNLFKLDIEDLNPQEAKEIVDKYIGIIAKVIYGKTASDEQKDALKKSFGLDDVDNNYNNYQNKLKQYFGQTKISKAKNGDPLEFGFGYNLEPYDDNRTSELNDWSSNNKVTEDELDQLKEKGYSAKNSIEELTNALNQFRKGGTGSEIKGSFNDVWDSIGTTGDDDTKKAAQEAKKKLLELAEAGKLTVEAFENSSIAEQFMKDTGLSAEEATKKINALVEETKQLSAMRTGITAITSAYDEKKDNKNKTVSASTLDSLGDTLGVSEWSEKDLDVWEKYKSIAADGTKGTKELKEAQDALATAFVNSNNFLANITDGTYDYYVGLLKEMGITNAAEIATYALNKAKINAKLATFDSSSATESDIATLGTYVSSLDDTGKQLAWYTLQQQIANNNALDTSDSINNLIALAEQCGITGKAISIMSAMSKNMETVEKYTTGSGKNDKYAGDYISSAEYVINQQEKQLKSIIKKGVKVTTKTSKGNKAKPSSSSDSKKDKGSSSNSKQQIDWISRALDRLSSKLDLVKAKYDNLVDSKKIKTDDDLLEARNKNLKEQYKILTKTEKYQSKAEKKYNKKAKSVKFSKKEKKKYGDLKKAVREGRISGSMKELIASYGEKTANKIQKYQDYYDKAQDAKKNKQSTIAAKSELEQQKNQNHVDLYDTRIARAEAKEATAIGAANKNKAVQTQIRNTRLSYDYQIRIAKLNKDKAKAQQLEYERDKKIVELQKQKIENIKTEYANRIALLESGEGGSLSGEKDLQNQVALLQAKGQIVTAGYYSAQNKIENEKLNLQKEELAKLISKQSTFARGSDEWYELQTDIQSTQDAINESQIAIAENTTAIRELHTTMLEEMAENANRMNSEADFLAALLSRDELTDSDTGTFTSAGIGTLGAYGINMEMAQSQIRELEKERAILEQMKKTGSLDYGDNGKHKYNSLNQFEEAYNNIIEKQKEWTQNEFDAEQKIIDLMKECYQAQLDYMKEIIDAKKTALDLEKDLYSYSKNIAEKTKNIATLEKRLTALKGDTSEEGRARMTQIQLQLDEANQDLQDTEYDRYISDQQNMLDNMYNEYEDLMNHLFKDTDKLLQEGIQAINSNGGFIKSILDKKAEEYGYNYSDNFSEIMGAFTTSGSIVTAIRDSINGKDDSTISKKLDAINATIEKKYNSDKTPKPDGGGGGDKGGAGGDTGGAGGGDSSYSGTTMTTNSGTSYENSIKVSDGKTKWGNDKATTGKSWKDQLKGWLESNATGKKKAKVEKKDKSKYKTMGSDLNQKLVKNFGYYLSSKNGGLKALTEWLNITAKDNSWSKEGNVYKELKELGCFRTGGIAHLVKSSGEDGFMLARNGEGFVAPEHVESIKELMNIVPDMTQFTNALTNIKPVNREFGNQTFGDINLQLDLPNVENAHDLVSELQTNNSRTQKAFIIAVKDLVAKGKITNNIQSIR